MQRKAAQKAKKPVRLTSSMVHRHRWHTTGYEPFKNATQAALVSSSNYGSVTRKMLETTVFFDVETKASEKGMLTTKAKLNSTDKTQARQMMAPLTFRFHLGQKTQPVLPHLPCASGFLPARLLHRSRAPPTALAALRLYSQFVTHYFGHSKLCLFVDRWFLAVDCFVNVHELAVHILPRLVHSPTKRMPVLIDEGAQQTFFSSLHSSQRQLIRSFTHNRFREVRGELGLHQKRFLCLLQTANLNHLARFSCLERLTLRRLIKEPPSRLVLPAAVCFQLHHFCCFFQQMLCPAFVDGESLPHSFDETI